MLATSDSGERAVDRVFFTPRGRARLVEGAVLFVDFLGVRAMNLSRHVTAHLVALQRAVSKTYRAFLAPHSTWSAAFFSDMLVLAAPVIEDDEESAIRDVIAQAARLQHELIGARFFMRGGLSLGKIHLRDGVVFGPALVEAHELESRVAVHPRILLSEAVERVLRQSMRTYEGQGVAVQSAMLMRDDDGRAFVNYLGRILLQSDDPNRVLERHRDVVVTQLVAYSNDKHLREKYRWVAEYHNAVVRRELPEATDLLVPASSMAWQFKAFA